MSCQVYRIICLLISWGASKDLALCVVFFCQWLLMT
jgi:hypothetical protein